MVSVSPLFFQSLCPFEGWWYVVGSVLEAGGKGIISAGLAAEKRRVSAETSIRALGANAKVKYYW
ncbi:MAG: hypothetical protein ACYTEQ_17555 [Planctomycetota bacterium]